MSQPATGLRERKKQQTRQLIADTARRLFAKRGFEGVTVAEVARTADVAEATVFNYFPTKEDLFYSGLEAFEERLLAAIRERKPGESALAAFGRFVLEPLAEDAARDGGSRRREGNSRCCGRAGHSAGRRCTGHSASARGCGRACARARSSACTRSSAASSACPGSGSRASSGSGASSSAAAFGAPAHC